MVLQQRMFLKFSLFHTRTHMHTLYIIYIITCIVPKLINEQVRVIREFVSGYKDAGRWVVVFWTNYPWHFGYLGTIKKSGHVLASNDCRICLSGPQMSNVKHVSMERNRGKEELLWRSSSARGKCTFSLVLCRGHIGHQPPFLCERSRDVYFWKLLKSWLQLGFQMSYSWFRFENVLHEK